MNAFRVVCANHFAATFFEVPDKMVVKDGVDYNAFEGEIKEAADSCPVSVIHVEEE